MASNSWRPADLARAMDKQVSTVTRILDGRTKKVKRDTLTAMNSALGVDLVAMADQLELVLDIEDDFLRLARDAIREHVRRAEDDLAADATPKEMVGVVSLRVHESPGTRVSELRFPLRPRWRVKQQGSQDTNETQRAH